MHIELGEYDELTIFTHMTHKLYEYHHLSIFFLIHVFFFYCSFTQDICGCNIEEVKRATSTENYKSHVQCRPLFQPITALRCVSEEVPGLFRMLSDHVQTTTFS